MTYLVDAFLRILELSLMAAVLTGLIFLLRWAFRSHLSAGWISALWLVVVLRLVIPVSFTSSLSLFNAVPVPSAVQIQQYTPGFGHTADLPPINTNIEGTESPQPNEVNPTEEMASDTSATSHATSTAITPTPAISLDPWEIIAIIWVIGVVLTSLYTAVSALRLSLLLRRHAQPIHDQGLHQQLEEYRQAMGVRQRIRLMHAPSLRVAAVYGWLRPIILLPADLNPSQIKHVLLHELAHIRRHDILLCYVMIVLRALHWFNPMVWFAFRGIKHDREPACDAMVLRRYSKQERYQYGMTLITMSAAYHRSCPSHMAAIFESKKQVKERVKRVSKFKKTTLMWTLIAIALILVIATIGLTARETSAPANSAYIGDYIYQSIEGDPLGKYYDANNVQSMELTRMDAGYNLQIVLHSKGDAKTIKQNLGSDTISVQPITGTKLSEIRYVTHVDNNTFDSIFHNLDYASATMIQNIQAITILDSGYNIIADICRTIDDMTYEEACKAYLHSSKELTYSYATEASHAEGYVIRSTTDRFDEPLSDLSPYTEESRIRSTANQDYAVTHRFDGSIEFHHLYPLRNILISQYDLMDGPSFYPSLYAALEALAVGQSSPFPVSPYLITLHSSSPDVLRYNMGADLDYARELTESYIERPLTAEQDYLMAYHPDERCVQLTNEAPHLLSIEQPSLPLKDTKTALFQWLHDSAVPIPRGLSYAVYSSYLQLTPYCPSVTFAYSSLGKCTAEDVTSYYQRKLRHKEGYHTYTENNTTMITAQEGPIASVTIMPTSMAIQCRIDRMGVTEHDMLEKLELPTSSVYTYNTLYHALTQQAVGANSIFSAPQRLLLMSGEDTLYYSLRLPIDEAISAAEELLGASSVSTPDGVVIQQGDYRAQFYAAPQTYMLLKAPLCSDQEETTLFDHLQGYDLPVHDSLSQGILHQNLDISEGALPSFYQRAYSDIPSYNYEAVLKYYRDQLGDTKGYREETIPFSDHSNILRITSSSWPIHHIDIYQDMPQVFITCRLNHMDLSEQEIMRMLHLDPPAILPPSIDISQYKTPIENLKQAIGSLVNDPLSDKYPLHGVAVYSREDKCIVEKKYVVNLPLPELTAYIEDITGHKLISGSPNEGFLYFGNGSNGTNSAYVSIQESGAIVSMPFNFPDLDNALITSLFDLTSSCKAPLPDIDAPRIGDTLRIGDNLGCTVQALARFDVSAMGFERASQYYHKYMDNDVPMLSINNQPAIVLSPDLLKTECFTVDPDCIVELPLDLDEDTITALCQLANE